MKERRPQRFGYVAKHELGQDSVLSDSAHTSETKREQRRDGEARDREEKRVGLVQDCLGKEIFMQPHRRQSADRKDM